MKRYRSICITRPVLGLHLCLILAAIAVMMAVSFILAAFGNAQEITGKTDPKSFISGMVGEWIGILDHKTNGEQAEDRYFHAVIRKVDDSTFSGHFDYYGIDGKTKSLVQAGDSTMTLSVAPDGTVTSKVEGKGEVLVGNKPKEQNHVFEEQLTFNNDGTITGKGKGKISVSGLPLGLGKNGKIRDSESRWTIKDGVFSIEQDLKADFKALVITKTFSMQANYSARRGADVAELINEKSRISGGVEVSRKP